MTKPTIAKQINILLNESIAALQPEISATDIRQKIAAMSDEDLVKFWRHTSKPEIKELDRNASIVDDLGADSLERVEIVMELENDFHIEIPDTDAAKLTTVGAIIDYVDMRLH